MSSTIIAAETTLGDRDKANALAAQAVQAGLAACAQVEGPVESTYVWDSRLERTPEFRVHFKTGLEKKQQLVEWLIQQHPYDCPQILCWEVESANPEYTSWVNGE